MTGIFFARENITVVLERERESC